MRRRTAAPILAAGLLLGAVQAGPQDEPPVFSSDTEVVVLDVVATDGKGRPVEDLRKEDLEVREDGTPCEILAFRLVRSAPEPPEAAPAPAAPRPDAPPSPAATPARASLVVLVFDRLTTTTAPLARQGALDLVSQPFPPDTWFAVFKVGYGVQLIRLLAPFTTDAARLEAAIEAATLGDPDKRSGPLGPWLPPTRVAERSPNETPGQPQDESENPGSYIPRLRTVAEEISAEEETLARTTEGLDSLLAVRGIARALAVVRGRKSIIYFAEAWHLPNRNRFDYDDVVSEANRANVAVHTVDVRGLLSRKPVALTAVDSLYGSFSADHGGGPGEGATTPRPDADQDQRFVEAREEALSGPRLERLALDTGGLAIQSTNDLGAGLAGVAQELRQYYEVVYAPANPVADGGFRRIGVKTSRRGVRLRTRAGYFATPERTATLPAYELPLMDALGARTPAHDFTLRARVLHFAPRGDERECLVLAEVPLSEVHLAADETRGAYRAHLALLGRVKDAAGRVVRHLTHDWPLEGPLDASTRARNAVFRSSLSLAPGGYVLEAAVQDRGTGARSVIREPFEVPPARGRLALASIVLPRAANPAADGSSPDEPLRVGSLSLVPDLGTPLEAGTRAALPVYVGVYPPKQDEPVALAVQLTRDDEILAQASPELPPSGEAGRLSWFGRLPTANLGPGSYDITVTARQGAEVAVDRTRLEVVAGRRAATASIRAAPPPDPDLAPVLEGAARYVVAYQETFRNVVAEERYKQRASSGKSEAFTRTAAPPLTLADGTQVQTTRADIVFVRLAGDVPWGVFRDVFEVNGSRVRDRDERLEALFREASSSALEQARQILAESARYNIGPRRTVNIPTLALLFLHPRNQRRFEFEKGGRRRFEGFEGLEVRFQEVQRPTLTRDAEGRSVPAHGKFWIDRSRGTVLRSEVRFRFEPDRAEGFVATEYRREPRLGMWVPSEMWERYRDFPGSHEPVFRHPAEANARYSDYRQFSVSVETSARVGEE